MISLILVRDNKICATRLNIINKNQNLVANLTLKIHLPEIFSDLLYTPKIF